MKNVQTGRYAYIVYVFFGDFFVFFFSILSIILHTPTLFGTVQYFMVCNKIHST